MATVAMQPADIFAASEKKATFFNEKAKVFNGDKTKAIRRPLGSTNGQNTKNCVTKIITRTTYIENPKKDNKTVYGRSARSAPPKTKSVTFSVPLPTSLPVSVHEASADLSKPFSAIDRLLADIPENVVKIDGVGASYFNSPIYAQDIINYLMARETKFALQPNFLERSGLKPRSRALLVDWLIQVQVFLGIETESLHVAIALLDRMLTKHPIPVNKLQLFGLVCLFIATKFNELFPPEISELLHLTENNYTRDELLAAERLVLRSVGFDLNLPTSFTFLDRCTQATEGELGDRIKEVNFMALFLLDLGMTDGSFTTIVPSLRAAAAYWLARRLLLPPTSVTWTPSLSWYTAYSEHELREVIPKLAKLCIKAPDSKFQAARVKYRSEGRYDISSHPSLDKHELLKCTFCTLRTKSDKETSA